jgi:hypothetical protein
MTFSSTEAKGWVVRYCYNVCCVKRYFLTYSDDPTLPSAFQNLNFSFRFSEFSSSIKLTWTTQTISQPETRKQILSTLSLSFHQLFWLWLHRLLISECLADGNFAEYIPLRTGLKTLFHFIEFWGGQRSYGTVVHSKISWCSRQFYRFFFISKLFREDWICKKIKDYKKGIYGNKFFFGPGGVISWTKGKVYSCFHSFLPSFLFSFSLAFLFSPFEPVFLLAPVRRRQGQQPDA